MNQYRCLDVQEVVEGDYSIVPIREQDIFRIKTWRNEQVDVLRQKVLLSDDDQGRYYRDVVLPTFSEQNPGQILFSFLYERECIGYGGLVHIDWADRRAEVSFLVATSRCRSLQTYKEDFTNYLTLIKRVGFEALHFNRLFVETYAIRSDHIRILEACGFVAEGRMRDHVLIGGRYRDSLIHGVLRKEYR